MLTLNKDYIINNFKLPETDTAVVLNGTYQPELSDVNIELNFENHIFKISETVKITKPLHILFITSKNCNNSIEIVAKDNQRMIIIEEYVSLGTDVYTQQSNVSIIAKKSSAITIYKLQIGNIMQANYQVATNILQEQNSVVNCLLVNRGSKTSSDNSHIKFSGKHAICNIRGVNFLRATQYNNHKILIEHLAPNCSSNVLFKGIVDDQSTENFDCRVIVHPGAIKTETHVTNKNLLLSDSAIVNSSPELEVYADDVICTHGATVGQLDQDALFYLRSRGIEKRLATTLLTSAFIQEITDTLSPYSRLKATTDLIHEQ